LSKKHTSRLAILIAIKAPHAQFAFLTGRVFRLRGCCMRAPSERDQCQAKLDILVEGFMHDDMPTYRDALAWLRNFADQKNIRRGRVMCGSYWYTPKVRSDVRCRGAKASST